MGTKIDVAKNTEDIRELYSRIEHSSNFQVESRINQEHLLHKVDEFLEAFKKHDDMEDEQYKELNDKVGKLDNGFQILSTQVSELKTSTEENTKSNKKFMKWVFIGSGVFIGLGMLATGSMWVINFIARIQATGLLEGIK